MSFDPHSFLKLAEQLYTDQEYQYIKEAALRTSISRAYYATFLSVRELVRAKLLDTYVIDMFEEVSTSGLIHSCIKKIIGRIDRSVGYMYGKLFIMRKKSDYNLNTTIKKKDVEEAIEIAKKIINSMRKLVNSIEVYRISDIIVDYYNRSKSRI